MVDAFTPTSTPNATNIPGNYEDMIKENMHINGQPLNIAMEYMNRNDVFLKNYNPKSHDAPLFLHTKENHANTCNISNRMYDLEQMDHFIPEKEEMFHHVKSYLGDSAKQNLSLQEYIRKFVDNTPYPTKEEYHKTKAHDCIDFHESIERFCALHNVYSRSSSNNNTNKPDIDPYCPTLESSITQAFAKIGHAVLEAAAAAASNSLYRKKVSRSLSTDQIAQENLYDKGMVVQPYHMKSDKLAYDVMKSEYSEKMNKPQLFDQDKNVSPDLYLDNNLESWIEQGAEEYMQTHRSMLFARPPLEGLIEQQSKDFNSMNHLYGERYGSTLDGAYMKSNDDDEHLPMHKSRYMQEVLNDSDSILYDQDTLRTENLDIVQTAAQAIACDTESISALKDAIRRMNNLLASGELTPQLENAHIRVRGVYFDKTNQAWAANMRVRGKVLKKSFALKKFGNEARAVAVMARLLMEQLHRCLKPNCSPEKSVKIVFERSNQYKKHCRHDIRHSSKMNEPLASSVEKELSHTKHGDMSEIKSSEMVQQRIIKEYIETLLQNS